MTLSALIRKRENPAVSIATPAIFATQTEGQPPTVARIATVARANPKNTESIDPAKFWRWLIHFTNREPLIRTFSPEVDQVEALASFPHAINAEPFPEVSDALPAPLTDQDESLILDWLSRIGETDIVTIAEVIDKCRSDIDARTYFIGRANERQTSEVWDMAANGS